MFEISCFVKFKQIKGFKLKAEFTKTETMEIKLNYMNVLIITYINMIII